MSADAKKLAANARAQIERLLTQLADLETLREDFDEEEIQEIKAQTLEQLEAFRASLIKLDSGSVELRDEMQIMRDATTAAIKAAFKTPEVLRMFVMKQPEALRERLRRAERDAQLGKMTAEGAKTERVEVLTALKKLGAPLEDGELEFLRAHMTAGLADFVEEK